MFNFFQKPFGLDIADYSIEVISLGGSVEKSKLLAMGRGILEPGIIEDGKILNKENLKKELLNLISNPKFGKIKNRNCIFCLPESKVFLHFFEIPKGLKKEEKLQRIKTEANETFPHPLEELYYDFIIYPDGEALLVAAPKNIVDDYLDIFKACQIKPIALEVESESLARALITRAVAKGGKEDLSSLTREKEGTVLIADIGTRTTNFGLFDKDRLRLSILIPVAGRKFTLAIAEKLKISFTEAENLKIKTGLNPEAEEGRVFLILQQELREIIEEVKKIEKYFQEKTGKQIEKIILTGGSAQLPYLPEYLSENLGKKVEIGDPWAKINIDILKKKEYLKEALKINPVVFSVSIGLALRGLIKDPKRTGINLIKEVKY